MLNQRNPASDMPGTTLPLAYPFNWEGIDDFRYPLDPQHVPRVFIDKQWGYRYNPITTAQFGLHNLTRYAETREPRYLNLARAQARWLLANAQPWANDALTWIYDYDLAFYGPRAPWISAMAQGEAISLLLRMQQIEPDERTVDITRRALQPFFFPVSKGGVASTFPDGSLVFEEYPTSPPSQVLNGHIFSLLGLHDYATFRRDDRAQRVFEGAVAGLKQNVQRYDTGYWNLYDLHPTHRLASPMYIRVHVQLLQILAGLTADAEFRRMAERWQGYLRSPTSRARWFVGKSIEKIRLKTSSPSHVAQGDSGHKDTEIIESRRQK